MSWSRAPRHAARWALGLASVACLGCAAQVSRGGRPANAPRLARAVLTLDGPRLRVSVCYPGAPGQVLRAGARSITAPESVRADVRGCADYSVALSQRAASRGWRRVIGERAALLSNRAWLLRPDGPARAMRLSLSLPAGTHAVVPWRAVGSGEYFDDGALLAWEGYLALASDAPRELDTAFARLRVTSLDPGSTDPTRWLRAAARAVEPLVAGRRLSDVQVILDGRRVPPDAPPMFGLTSRGGGRSLLFVVGRDADGDALVGEWIAVHEMVHLVLPVLRDDASWLGEGIATYYQEVLRARAGLIPRRASWANLVAGFESARASAGGRTLAEVAAQGGSYTFLYWSAAAFAMRADVALRRRGTSLDEVVRRWRLRLADTPVAYAAGELIADADEALGAPVLAPLMRDALTRPGAEDLSELIASLGVARDGSEGPSPLHAIRDAIMGPSRGSPPAR